MMKEIKETLQFEYNHYKVHGFTGSFEQWLSENKGLNLLVEEWKLQDELSLAEYLEQHGY